MKIQNINTTEPGTFTGRALDSRGEGIGMADSLIAGTVIRHRGTLLTRNRRHFERVDGLTLATLDL